MKNNHHNYAVQNHVTKSNHHNLNKKPHHDTSSITSTWRFSNLKYFLSSIWHKLPRVETTTVGGSACKTKALLQKSIKNRKLLSYESCTSSYDNLNGNIPHQSNSSPHVIQINFHKNTSMRLYSIYQLLFHRGIQFIC